MRALRNPFPVYLAAMRALVEPLENRQLLSATFAHAGATAMAYDAAGTLHMAYYDTAARTLNYAERDAGGAWSATITIDPGPQVGSSLAIAVDSSGHAGIAYYDAKKADLKYAHFNGGMWDITRVDSTGSVGQNPSLAFDLSDHPLISYYSASGGDLKLAQFDGVHWLKTAIDRKGTAGQFSSIAINPADGSWAIAYDETTKRQVRYATQSGQRLTLDTMNKTKGWTTDLSLAFTAGGAPAVSFYDPAAGSLNLTSFSGSGTWSTQNIATGNIGAQSTLTFDPISGAPQVAYFDRTGGTINLATGNGGGWSTVSLGAGSNVSVARDPLTNSFSALFTGGGSNSSIGSALNDPTNLAATVISNSQINLLWTDNSTIETGFVIERSADGGANFASLGQVNANVTAYSDTTAGDGQSYVYRVKAIDLTSSSHWISSNTVTTTLNAPTNLQATKDTDGSVHLSWQDSSVGVGGFRVEISRDGVGFASTGLTDASTMQFDDASAGVDNTWYYRVVPFNADGDGPATSPLLVHTAPAAPSGLQIFGEGSSMFELIWSPVSGLATSLLVQERLAGTSSAFQTLDTLGADQISDIVTLDADGNLLSPNTAYEYRIIAVNGDGDPSADSNHATGSTGLIAPENVVATAVSSTAALLTWEPNSGAATHYNVYLSTDGITYNLYSPTFQQASALNLPDLLPSTHYWLKVTAANDASESAGAVAEVDTLPGTPGAAPTNVAAQVSWDNPLWLSVSWSNAASDAVGFHIQRSRNGVDFTTIEDVPATWATYDDPSVVEGLYYYRVQTFTATGDGATSGVVSATAYLANPINLQAIVTTTGTMNLSWTNVSTLANSLQLYAAGDDFDATLVDDSIDPSATSYQVTHFADGTPLTSGANYWFYLVPSGDIDALGSSQWAHVTNGFGAPAEVSVTPSGAGEMTINWADVGDETGYQIESSTDGITYNTVVATVSADVTSYVQTGLLETANLYYRVKALSNGGDSAYIATGQNAVAPNAPTNLVVTPLAGGLFHLTWDDNSSNEDGYSVSVTTADGDVLIPAQLPPNATSCTITETNLSGLGLPGREFKFQVIAFRWQGAASPPAEVEHVQALGPAAE
ncbi:MAG TPA: fibronectin type III domain-containing protein [Humisphaera sp.]|jgi:titin|nr:fibronectin type III domain-containing protein [Humisphaera sp.]